MMTFILLIMFIIANQNIGGMKYSDSLMTEFKLYLFPNFQISLDHVTFLSNNDVLSKDLEL